MQTRKYLLVGTLFLGLVVITFALAAFRDTLPSFGNVLMLFAGLFAMAALSAFHRLIDSAKNHPFVVINFNADVARAQLEQVEKTLPENVIDAEFSVAETPWEIEPEDLLGRDNSLAVAKLRIDLERELRKIASKANVGKDASRLGLRRLASELVRVDALNKAFLPILDDILPAANEAIHGGRISPDTAIAILAVGKDLIRLLRRSSDAAKMHPKNTVS